MKLTRNAVLSAAGIALVVGLFTWSWIATDRHHSNPVHMGYAVQQMHDEMPNGAMPMPAMHTANDYMDMTEMPMTVGHRRHMESMGMGWMGMGAVVGPNADHMQHHGQRR